MLTVVTRKQQLLAAFQEAGRRGLTATEMQRVVGAFWKLRLRELRDDGCLFCERPSRRGRRGTFRWVLVTEAPLAGDDADDVERLLDPPASPPGNAIFGGDA